MKTNWTHKRMNMKKKYLKLITNMRMKKKIKMLKSAEGKRTKGNKLIKRRKWKMKGKMQKIECNKQRRRKRVSKTSYQKK